MKRVAFALAAFVASAGGVLADDNAIDATIVADQVRNQGVSCQDPVSAAKDAAASKPELPVYVLTCADAVYQVKVVPDQAWVITKQ